MMVLYKLIVGYINDTINLLSYLINKSLFTPTNKFIVYIRGNIFIYIYI